MKRHEILTYFENALKLFVVDPPDSDFNDGYLAALKEAYKTIATPAEIDEALIRAIDKIEK